MEPEAIIRPKPVVSIYEDPSKIFDLMDIHGFILKSKKEYEEKQERNRERFIFLQKRTNARIEKWRTLIPILDSKINKTSRSRKCFLLIFSALYYITIQVKKKIRKGIPDCLRGIVWIKLSQITKIKQEVNETYNQLKEANSPYENEIRLDVNRTFPNHAFFSSKNHVGQNSLQIVLKALSLVFKDMGYCQGLNFIAAALLLYLNDEEAFWVMVSLMNKYELLQYYQDLICIKKPFYVFEELLKRFLPKIHEHFNKLMLMPEIYAPGWFLTLYVSFLPFHIVLRILDIFLYEGYKIIYRVGLAILKIKEEKILKMKQMDQIMLDLKCLEEKEFEDEDLFIESAHKFVFTYSEIKKIENSFEKLNSKKAQKKNEARK